MAPHDDPITMHAATAGPTETRALAAALAALVRDGDLIVLTGDLGAGKTCFTQGLGAGLGVEDRITSPTFTLASVYEGRLRLNHLDVYRLDGAADALDLDLPELAEHGVTVVEWGEQIDPALGSDRLAIAIRFGAGDDDRLIEMRLEGPAWAERAPAVQAAVSSWAATC
ncbi:MAG: tRNA (adenosine(37)-N6)-threonylcarbamoyltransferase complex ATPase subunit type 1 TsaE [Actinomycetota bacterium]